VAALEKFQAFLRELFQLDLADLDFGIYRLLHIKHDEIADFLNEQLPRRVMEAFERMAGDAAGTLKAEIDELAAKIREDVADDAILETGAINPDFQLPATKAAKRLLIQYAEKWEKLKFIQASETEQNDVFNHLYAFFSRYYDNGDFIPRRRYGAREAYAVPYNGEETLFHWANRDQHYVKTGERFRDYAFTVDTPEGACHIRFCLTDANLPPGNTKGEYRYFFPLPADLDIEGVSFSPPGLNPAESLFMEHVHDFWENRHNEPCFRNIEIYLLRNLPGAGIGFYRHSGFFPDFILWIKNKIAKTTQVVFIDPHGMHHGGLSGNQDKIQAMKALENLSAEKAFQKKRIALKGYILTETRIEDIPDVELNDWKTLRENCNILQQDTEKAYLNIVFGVDLLNPVSASIVLPTLT
jgi:hypothetical protein